jgi:hypothetical protein
LATLRVQPQSKEMEEGLETKPEKSKSRVTL